MVLINYTFMNFLLLFIMQFFIFTVAFCLTDKEMFLCKMDIRRMLVLSLGVVPYPSTCPAVRQLVPVISSTELCSVSSQTCQRKNNKM